MRNVTQRGMTVNKIRVRRTEILDIIRKNYEAHKQAYQEAFDGYKIEAAECIATVKKKFLTAIKDLETRVEKSDRTKGEKPVPLTMTYTPFNKIVPEDHSPEYEVVIRMLELQADDIIEIEQDRFECYVMDRWEWKAAFETQHLNYSNKLLGARPT